MSTDTRVLVLAGGIGRRFWPLTGSKSLFSFAGEPLMLTNIRRLAKAGFSRFTIVTTLSDREALASLSIPGVSLDIVVQEEPLGMGDAVLQAKSAIGDSSCLVLNAHDVVDDGLTTTLAAAVSEGTAFIVGKTVDAYVDVGYLKTEGGRLTGIVEKPGAGSEPGNQISLVFHFFPKFSSFASHIDPKKPERDDAYEQALTRYCQENEVRVVAYDGLWIPMKYPWHVLDVLTWRLSRLEPFQGKNVRIGKHVILEGAVVLADGVQVRENTKIIGPAYIGEGTIIGNNNIIRESHIGAGCVTGFNTDITRSWIGDNCWFHSNYLGDSVVASNVSLGAGTKLANLRLDEQEIFSVVAGSRMATGRTKLGVVVGSGVRMGVNASIMPGIKIGRDAFVGAGVVLDQDLQDGMFCYAKSGYEIKPNTRRAATESRSKFKAKI